VPVVTVSRSLVRTGGGGWHYYLAPTGLGNNQPRGLVHVDWRGRGGYVVALPSRHRSGQAYQFVADRDLDAPLAEELGRVATARKGERNRRLWEAGECLLQAALCLGKDGSGGESGLPGQARLSLVQESPLTRLMRLPGTTNCCCEPVFSVACSVGGTIGPAEVRVRWCGSAWPPTAGSSACGPTR
jgi:Bifunctional DNA primase/polymerase, N-terminal